MSDLLTPEGRAEHNRRKKTTCERSDGFWRWTGPGEWGFIGVVEFCCPRYSRFKKVSAPGCPLNKHALVWCEVKQ